MATAKANLSVVELAEQLSREGLIGVSRAAQVIGIKAPNFKRDAAPRLTAVSVEGSADVYFRSEVERLAAERQHARAARSNGAAPSGRERRASARPERRERPLERAEQAWREAGA